MERKKVRKMKYKMEGSRIRTGRRYRNRLRCVVEGMKGGIKGRKPEIDRRRQERKILKRTK